MNNIYITWCIANFDCTGLYNVNSVFGKETISLNLFSSVVVVVATLFKEGNT